jgi:hypothetical protein
MLRLVCGVIQIPFQRGSGVKGRETAVVVMMLLVGVTVASNRSHAFI